MIWSLLLDLLIAVLLAVTIVYAVTLNRRLGNLRGQRAELENGVAGFQQSIKRAEESVGQLKISADGLQERLDESARIQSDLAFLIERGETLADRLEKSVRAARDLPGNSRSRPAAGAYPSASSARAAEPARSETERELLKALAGGRT